MNLDDLLKSIREEDDDSKGGKNLDDLLESIRSEEKTSTINPAKFFDNDKYDDYYKELVDEGSIDDLNLSEEERQKGIAAFRSNKLDFKKFVLDIQSLKPEVEQLNQEPLTIKEQFFTAPKIEPSKLIPAENEEAPKIEPSKLIPSEDIEVNEEFIEKLDELISVIRKDNQLEEERLKLENLDDEREKRGKREDRIENKKQTKSFLSNLKKSTGTLGGFFDKLKRFLTFALLGGIISSLYNFIMDPKNAEKIKATQKFFKNYWPAVLGALAYFFTPFGKLVNFVVGTVGKFLVKLGLLVAKNPILAAAIAGAAGAAFSAMSVEERRKKLDEEDDDSVVTPEEFLKENQTPGLPQLLEEGILQRGLGGAGFGAFSGGGFAMGTDTVPAMLTPGEFIMSRGAVNMFGVDTLMAMNKAGGGTNRPKYGKVLGYSGGGLFGEAPLTKAARAAGYKDKELAAFLAQMSHETGNFQFKRELGGGASHYGGGGPYTLPDGRVVPAKYHGRGYVQLTHDYNYKKYGDRLGIDLLNNPELALDGDIAARIAVEYWKDHVRPTVKGDWDNVFLHSKAINLPSATSPSQVRGMSDRQKKYDEYLKKIMSQKPSQIMPAMPTAPGSLGPAFSDNTSMKDLSKQQLLRDRSSSIRSKLSNPLETFVFTPLRRALSVGTPNVPTETRNFMMPPVETPKQNQSSNQTGDIPAFNISSGNRMRDLVSKDLGIHDLVGAS